MRFSLLVASAATCSALNLGAALTRTPPVARSVGLRMQVPETSEKTSTDEVGVVVPTMTAAENDAFREKLLAQHPELGTVFRRAEFWSNETATLLDVINVIGRFDKCADFRERTVFSVVDDPRKEDEKQGETRERYDMAVRMNCASRVALYQNGPNLPFTNAALATSVGMSVEDFQGLAVTKAACNVVFDALAESRSGLIPYDTLDERRAALLGADASFNELGFRSGLYKSRALIIIAWFLFGKGNFVWVLVSVKFLHDWKPELIPSPVDMGLFKIGTFI